MTRSLFDVTPERAAEIRRKLGFLTLEERDKQQHLDEAANRPPTPYVETPEHLKRERAETLRRRLAAAGDHYSG